MINFLKNLYALKPIFEQLSTPIFMSAPEFEEASHLIIYANEAFCKMSGYERNEVIGSSLKLFQGEKTDLALLEKLKDRLRHGEHFEGNSVSYKKDGSEYWVKWNISPIHDEEGTIVCFLSIQHDLSELKGMEDRFKLATEATKDGLWDWDLSSNKVFFSTNWKNMLGFTQEEIGDELEEWSKRVHPSDIQKAKEDIKTHLDGHSEYYINEHRMLCKDGKYKWILDRGKALFDAKGKAYRFIGFHTDISEQKELEGKLISSDFLLRKISEQIPGIIYTYKRYPDGRSCFPFVSEHIADIYELTPIEVKEDASVVFERIHPDDLEKVAMSIENSYQTLELWECEYRVNLPKKGLRWLQGRSNPEKQLDGSVIWYGYIHDITERKVLEEELQSRCQKP